MKTLPNSPSRAILAERFTILVGLLAFMFLSGYGWWTEYDPDRISAFGIGVMYGGYFMTAAIDLASSRAKWLMALIGAMFVPGLSSVLFFEQMKTHVGMGDITSFVVIASIFIVHAGVLIWASQAIPIRKEESHRGFEPILPQPPKSDRIRPDATQQ